MRIIFFGTSRFAVPALRAVSSHLVLVVTQPDRPAGRGRVLKPTPVKEVAMELGLPVEAPERCRATEFVSRIEDLQADALLVAAYGQILPESLLVAAKRGGINLHGSVLPKYRGAAPIPRAILAGETETGVTLMQMDKGMDTGEIIAIERTQIYPDETAGELEDRLAVVAAEMVGEWLPRIVAGDYPRKKQDDNLATLAPKMKREDGELSWEGIAVEVYSRFLACTPRPGAYCETRFGKMKVIEARLDSSIREEPGCVTGVGGGCLTVAFAEGGLSIRRAQLEGRRAVSGADLANGLRLKAGESLA